MAWERRGIAGLIFCAPICRINHPFSPDFIKSGIDSGPDSVSLCARASQSLASGHRGWGGAGGDKGLRRVGRGAKLNQGPEGSSTYSLLSFPGCLARSLAQRFSSSDIFGRHTCASFPLTPSQVTVSQKHQRECEPALRTIQEWVNIGRVACRHLS